jgi:hypothetical protein
MKGSFLGDLQAQQSEPMQHKAQQMEECIFFCIFCFVCPLCVNMVRRKMKGNLPTMHPHSSFHSVVSIYVCVAVDGCVLTCINPLSYSFPKERGVERGHHSSTLAENRKKETTWVDPPLAFIRRQYSVIFPFYPHENNKK